MRFNSYSVKYRFPGDLFPYNRSFMICSPGKRSSGGVKILSPKLKKKSEPGSQRVKYIGTLVVSVSFMSFICKCILTNSV